MKPPATVAVGPHLYRVILDDDGLLGDNSQCGHTAAGRLVIALDGDQEPSQLADTLLHELGQALLPPAGLTAAIEERVCLTLGPALLALIRANPDLIAYLTEPA